MAAIGSIYHRPNLSLLTFVRYLNPIPTVANPPNSGRFSAIASAQPQVGAA